MAKRIEIASEITCDECGQVGKPGDTMYFHKDEQDRMAYCEACNAGMLACQMCFWPCRAKDASNNVYGNRICEACNAELCREARKLISNPGLLSQSDLSMDDDKHVDHSVADGGVWISCWVWVPREEAEDE